MNLPDFLTESEPGEIVVTGHRIGLYSIARRHKAGMTAEEIAEEFPTLTLEQVRRVIAFAEENREEVDRYVEDYRREARRQEELYYRPEMKEKLRQRWQQLYPDRPLPGTDR